MKPSPLPVTAEQLWEQTTMDLWTGRLYPKEASKRRQWDPRKPLGTSQPAGNGYHYISLGGKRLLAHRVIYKWIHGIDPLGEIDHIDRVRTNNSPFNLRVSDRRGQALNSAIHIHAAGTRFASNKWYAYHNVGSRTLSAGGFDTEAEAVAARRALVSAANHFLNKEPT